MNIPFLAILTIATGVTLSEARLGGSHASRSLFLPQTRLVPTLSPTATPVFAFDRPVQLVNIGSNRFLYAVESNQFDDTAGASVIEPSNDNGEYLWNFRQVSCPPTEDSETTCYLIENLVNRELYASTFDTFWTSGVGAYSGSGGLGYETGRWVLEEGVCNDGTTECYRIRNADSNRRLFAQENRDGTNGYGASNPNSQTFYADQFWEIRNLPTASLQTTAPTLPPSPSPTRSQTKAPTLPPSSSPTRQPTTDQPSEAPTEQPSERFTSLQPSVEATTKQWPSQAVTGQPSDQPQTPQPTSGDDEDENDEFLLIGVIPLP